MPKYLNVREVRPGRFRARLYFPFDPVLGYKPKPKDFYATSAKEADRLRRHYETEKPTLDHKTTLLSFIKDEFIPYQKSLVDADQLSYSYYSRQKMLFDRFFISPEYKILKNHALRQIALGDLLPLHIEAWFKCLKATKASDEYKARMKHNFRAALKYGKDRVPHKVSEYFADLEVAGLPERQKPPTMFSLEDIWRVIHDESLPLEPRCIVAFEAITMCRPSEMWAMKWSDVDLEFGTYNITKALKLKSGGSFAMGKTKTKKGSRYSEPLGPELTALLTRLHSIRKPKVSDHIFLTLDSRVPVNVQNFRKMWPKIKEMLNLPDGPRFYDLKHWGNSFLAMQGVSAKVRAERMGHTTTKMAENVYHIVTPEAKQKAVAHFGQPIIASPEIKALNAPTKEPISKIT